MHNNELFTQFTQKAEFIRSQIDIISVSLSEEKIPDKSIVQDVITGIDNLRSLHKQIREYAGSFLPEDKIPSEDAPVSDFRIAIEQSLAFQIQKKFDEIGAIIQKFLSVYSEVPESNTELKIYQDQASVLFDDLQDTQQISEDAEKIIDAYSAFLTLVPMKDNQSDEWYEIFDPLDDSKVFSRLLMRRLSRHDFNLPIENDIKTIEKKEKMASVTESLVTKIEKKNNEEGKNNIVTQSETSEKTYLTPRKPIKNKTASTGSFLKIIQNEPSLFKVDRLLPLLQKLGPISFEGIKNVWGTFDRYSPILRHINKYFELHPNLENKFFKIEDVNSNESDSSDNLESFFMPDFEYLEKNNVISLYDFPGEKNFAVCLTPYAYECMSKEKVRNLRYDNPPPISNFPSWENYFQCSRKFIAKDHIPVDDLRKAIISNDTLLTYANLVSRQMELDDMFIDFMKKIEWDGEHYHVNVYKNNESIFCTLLNADEIPDSSTPVLFCIPNPDTNITFSIDRSGPVFLNLYDSGELLEWNGIEWKVLYKISNEDPTSDIQEENQSEIKNDQIIEPNEDIISPDSENTSDNTFSGKTDDITNKSEESILTLNENDNSPEISNEVDQITEEIILPSQFNVPDDTKPFEDKEKTSLDESDKSLQSLEIDSESFEKKILLSMIESRSIIPEDADFNNLSASDMAMYLYENNIDPAPVANHEFFFTLVYQLISEKNLHDAVLLARALSTLENQQEYTEFCKLVEAGCDIEPFTELYTGTELQKLNNIFEKRNYRKEDYVIILAAAIRGLFCPDNETDYPDYLLRDLATQIVDMDIFPNKKISGNIKNLIVKLSDMMVTIPSGFSDDVLNLFKKTGSKEKLETEFSKQAEMLMKIPSNLGNKTKDISLFSKEHFGTKSKFHKMLSFVQQRDHTKGDEVAHFLDEYIDKYKDFSESNIQQFILDLWRISVGPGKPLYFHGNNIIRLFSDRFALLEKWVHLISIEKYTMSDQKKETALKTRKEVLEYIRQINTDLSDNQFSDLSTSFALSHMLTNLYDMLQTEDIRMKSEITNDWYRTYYLIFDENGIPVCDQGLNQILYCEPWRIVLRHLLTEKINPEDAVKHIYDDSFGSYWGDNYGLAKWLIESNELLLSQGTTPKDLDHAYFTVYFSEHFEKVLVMDVFHGRLTESQKDDLIEAEKSFRRYFRESENFGQYRYFLNSLLQQAEMICHYQTKEKMTELDNLPEEIKIERKDDIQKINKLIYNRHFTAVDDKLKRLKNNEDALWITDGEKSYFDHFLSVYDDIYKLLKDNRGLEVATFYGSVLGKNKNWEKEFSNAYKKSRKSRKNIFPNWGKENVAAVETLFEELDVPVKNVKKDNEFFVLTVEPSQQNLPEYPHPIAKFGTRMSDKIRVIYKKGVVTANSINDISKKNSIGGTGIIILADYAIPLDDRRKIVEDFMSSDKEYPFIVIDRVLLFYLAAQVEVDRMQVLLECTLPFSYTQPYVDGKGDVPDEMFFGRHNELTKIRLGTPSCFVYGGRQLGKTALLRRTGSLENQPEEKQYAVYFDAKDNNVEKTVSQISGKLHKLNIISNQPKNMEDLCSSIERKLNEGKSIKRLLLLIDEADAYLADDRKNAYDATKKLWDLHREYPHDFKFVFAGLHNVARTANGSENNSLIGQFNMVSIGQLSKKDAEQLIQKPLRYLGFRLKDEQIASIIENANYYPGVLQYFCYKMLEEVYGNYRNHFSALKKNPPFEIKEENLKKIISKANLSQEIKDRLLLTLKLDDRYMFFANLIAYLYYTDRENGILNPYGYSLRTIKNNGKEFAPELDDYDYEQILPEMVEMGILSKENANYKLRRASFLEMINDEESVTDYLLSEPFHKEEMKDE